MVKYYGRARLRVGSVNTNQLGLKMSGCPSKVGRSGRIDRYISRRSHCGIVFCGWVWYHGIKWKQNHWVNPYTKEINWRCIPAAPITRALAGGVGRLNAPRFRCAKDCGRQPWWTWTNNPHSSPRVEEQPSTLIVDICTIPFVARTGNVPTKHEAAPKLYIYFTDDFDTLSGLNSGTYTAGQSVTQAVTYANFSIITATGTVKTTTAKNATKVEVVVTSGVFDTVHIVTINDIEVGTPSSATDKAPFTGADSDGQPDEITLDTGNAEGLIVARFEDICPGYKSGASPPFSSLNKNYKIIATSSATPQRGPNIAPFGWHAFLVQGPISLRCKSKKTSSSDPVKYWTNPTAVFWACNGVSGPSPPFGLVRGANCGGGITLPAPIAWGGAVGNIFRQDHRCKFVEILWRQNLLKLYSNNSTHTKTPSPMPNIPQQLQYVVRNIPYLPPPPAVTGPAGDWMCIPLASLDIGGVDPNITKGWYNSMKTTIYTYDENGTNTFEAVLALCDTGGSVFLINDPSKILMNALKKEKVYPGAPTCPGGYYYGTELHPFGGRPPHGGQWSVEFGNCSPPEQSCALTIPAAPGPEWPAPLAGAAIGPPECGTGQNTVNLGGQLFLWYDVIINVQTPSWWEDDIMKPRVTLDGIYPGTYRAGATVLQPQPPDPPATGVVATTVENSTTVVVIVTSGVPGYTPTFGVWLGVYIDGKFVGTPDYAVAAPAWNLYPCQAPDWVHADLPGRPPLASDTSGNRFQIGFKVSTGPPPPCPCSTATSPCPPEGNTGGACCHGNPVGPGTPCETRNWTKETCVPPYGTWCDASTTEDVLDP